MYLRDGSKIKRAYESGAHNSLVDTLATFEFYKAMCFTYQNDVNATVNF